MPQDFALGLEDAALTPLRPVTTRWRPVPAAAEEGAFARPFVAGAAGPRSGPGDDPGMAAPWQPEEEMEETGAAAVVEAGEEVRMPWEEGPLPDGSLEPESLPPVGEPAAGEPDRPFPLDAFLIPENSTRLPAGLENDRDLQDRIAEDVADALSDLVARLRAEGLDALLNPSARHEPVDVVLAAVLSGYLSRRAH